MTSNHQVSLTLLSAITATMLAVTATVASFVVIPTPQARSAEAIAVTYAAPVSATIAGVQFLEVAGKPTVSEQIPALHVRR